MKILFIVLCCCLTFAGQSQVKPFFKLPAESAVSSVNWEMVGFQKLVYEGEEYGITNLVSGGDKIYASCLNAGEHLVFEGDGDDWKYLGTAGVSDTRAIHSMLAINDGVLYCAFADKSKDNRISVVRFNGEAFVHVGKPGFSKEMASAIRIDFDNDIPYVAFQDYKPYGSSVMRFDGKDWYYVGKRSFSTSMILKLVLEVNAGIPYVFVDEYEFGERGSVMKFTGKSWEYLGERGAMERMFARRGLFIINAVPHVLSFGLNKDLPGTSAEVTRNELQVMKFQGGKWSIVHRERFELELSAYSFATMDGKPVLLYTRPGTREVLTELIDGVPVRKTTNAAK